MLQPELKLRRDKIRVLMAQQEIDAALITCNVNLIYTYGRVVSGYLYLPLNAPARLFIKRPNNIEGEHIHSIRKPEQLPDLLKECGLPLPAKLMLEGDELSYTEYTRLAACFPETTVVNGTPLIRKARSVKTNIEIEMFRRSGIAHTKAYEQIPSVYRPGMTDRQLSIEIERLMRLEGCLGIFRTFGQSMSVQFVCFIVVVLFGYAADAVEPGASFFSATVGYGKGQRHIFLIGGGHIDSRLFDGCYQLFQDRNRIVHFLIFMVIDFRFSVVRQKTSSGQVGIGPVHFQLVFPFQILPCGVQGIVEGFFYAQERVYAVRDKQFYSLVSGADKGKYGVQHFIGKEAVAPHCRFFGGSQFVNIYDKEARRNLHALLFAVREDTCRSDIR